MGYFFDEEDESLEHHGILGQKWGVRRFQRKDGTRTPAGKERAKENAINADENNEEEVVKQRKQMDPNTKKAIIIGASVAGGMLAAYGGYRLYSVYKHSGESDKTGFIKKVKDMTADEDMKYVNDGRRFNPAFDLRGHFSNNCQKCSIAYEMRRRGYDVKAGETPGGEYTSDIFKIFKGLDADDPTHHIKLDADEAPSLFNFNIPKPSNPKKDAEAFVEAAQKLGKNSRGVCSLQSMMGGHSVAWENDKHGNVVLRDCQIGKKYTGVKEIESYMRMSGMHCTDISKINDLPINVGFLKEKSQIGKSPYIRNSKDLEFGLTELQGALATAGTATVAGLVTGNYTKTMLDEKGGATYDTRTSKDDSTKETSKRN